MTALVDVRGAVVKLGARTIIHDVTLSVPAGQVVALVGPNGAGKSTLLRLIAGDLQPAAGSIALKGRALHSYTPQELARHRAVLSQHTFVAFPFTVDEIVRMGAGDRRPKSWVDDAAHDAMQRCDIGHLALQVVTRLSGGEQQRVHFARTLLQSASGDAQDKPGLLLLDEPTASLDLRHQLRVIDILRQQAAAGDAVIVVVHDLNLAAMMAHRVVMMKDGVIAADGPPAEVICDDQMRRVFDVANAVRTPPARNMPFVLPQSMTVADNFQDRPL